MEIYLRLSSWLIPTLWPIMWAIVPASKCGSYTLISTLMPTAFVVQTVSGTATPASPPANVSPLNDVKEVRVIGCVYFSSLFRKKKSVKFSSVQKTRNLIGNFEFLQMQNLISYDRFSNEMYFCNLLWGIMNNNLQKKKNQPFDGISTWLR